MENQTLKRSYRLLSQDVTEAGTNKDVSLGAESTGRSPELNILQVNSRPNTVSFNGKL